MPEEKEDKKKKDEFNAVEVDWDSKPQPTKIDSNLMPERPDKPEPEHPEKRLAPNTELLDEVDNKEKDIKDILANELDIEKDGPDMKEAFKEFKDIIKDSWTVEMLNVFLIKDNRGYEDIELFGAPLTPEERNRIENDERQTKMERFVEEQKADIERAENAPKSGIIHSICEQMKQNINRLDETVGDMENIRKPRSKQHVFNRMEVLAKNYAGLIEHISRLMGEVEEKPLPEGVEPPMEFAADDIYKNSKHIRTQFTDQWGNRIWVIRDKKTGKFVDIQDPQRCLAIDRAKKAKTKVAPGYGFKGDIPKKEEFNASDEKEKDDDDEEGDEEDKKEKKSIKERWKNFISRVKEKIKPDKETKEPEIKIRITQETERHPFTKGKELNVHEIKSALAILYKKDGKNWDGKGKPDEKIIIPACSYEVIEAKSDKDEDIDMAGNGNIEVEVAEPPIGKNKPIKENKEKYGVTRPYLKGDPAGNIGQDARKKAKPNRKFEVRSIEGLADILEDNNYAIVYLTLNPDWIVKVEGSYDNGKATLARFQPYKPTHKIQPPDRTRTRSSRPNELHGREDYGLYEGRPGRYDMYFVPDNPWTPQGEKELEYFDFYELESMINDMRDWVKQIDPESFQNIPKTAKELHKKDLMRYRDFESWDQRLRKKFGREKEENNEEDEKGEDEIFGAVPVGADIEEPYDTEGNVIKSTMYTDDGNLARVKENDDGTWSVDLEDAKTGKILKKEQFNNEKQMDSKMRKLIDEHS